MAFQQIKSGSVASYNPEKAQAAHTRTVSNLLFSRNGENPLKNSVSSFFAFAALGESRKGRIHQFWFVQGLGENCVFTVFTFTQN